jgi:hypothetical protein
MSSVCVKVVEGIVVTDPTTMVGVLGIRPALTGLIATQVATDRRAKVSERAVFVGLAFGKAIERARKLGWSESLGRGTSPKKTRLVHQVRTVELSATGPATAWEGPP